MQRRRDVLLDGATVRALRRTQHVFGVLNLLAQPRVSDGSRCLVDAAGRVPGRAARRIRERLQIGFELVHAARQLLLARLQGVCSSGAAGARGVKCRDLCCQLLLLGGEGVGTRLRLLHIALAACLLLPLQSSLGPLQRIGSGCGLCAGVAAIGRRSLLHGRGGVLQLAHGIAERLPRLLARELLQPSGRLVHFARQLPLRLRTSASATPTGPGLRAALLAFRLGLLPSGEFLQLLGQRIHCLVRRLLSGVLLQFVLISELVHLQFEQAGQVFGRLRASTSAPAAALLLGDLHLVLLFRLLQQLERSLLG